MGDKPDLALTNPDTDRPGPVAVMAVAFKQSKRRRRSTKRSKKQRTRASAKRQSRRLSKRYKCKLRKRVKRV